MQHKLTNEKIIGISEMKFMLILGVVLIHCNVIDAYSPANYQDNLGIRICSFFSSIVCSVCVPCFFIISGFLFFKNVDIFTYKLYIKKIKSRFKTLVIPYIFWCALCCFLLYIKHRYFHMSGLNIFLDDGNINWVNFVKGFLIIDEADKLPYAFAFWFIRNLIVLIFLSPIVWIIAKKRILFVLFILAYIILDTKFYGLEWFVSGAFLSVNKINIVKFNKYKLLFYSIFFLTICLVRTSMTYTPNILFIFQVVSALYVTYYLALIIHAIEKNYRFLSFLVSSTFMIYATHQCYCTKVQQIFCVILGCENILEPIVAYILCFVTLVLLGLLGYYILNKISPKFLVIITGGR